MTKDDVLKLAIEADLVEPRDISNDVCGLPEAYVDSLVAFAALVAEHEREECAKVCETQYRDYEWAIHERDGAKSCAAAIRARGQE